MNALAVMTVATPILVLTGTVYSARVTKAKALVLAQKAEVVEEKADAIHVLVNSRLDEALKRIAHLEAALNIEPGAPLP